MTLLDLNLTQLTEEIVKIGEKPFRAKQIMQWLSKGVSLEKMSNLSESCKKNLNFTEGYLIEKKVLLSTDGTQKFLLELHDKNTIESVLMQRNYGNTLCVSTQVGCKMGCVFCASCQKGLERNLSSGEIIAQVIHANKICTISNIVLMGIGEPLDNYENVVKFIKDINAKESLNIGMRNISISTCGITQNMVKLAQENMQCTLSISLHAPNDEKRRQIMPIANKHSIKEIMECAKYYFEKTHRRIIIEYIMIDNFNDTKEDANELSCLVKNINCHINLIPLNDTGGLKATPKNKQYAFLNMLEDMGASVTIRKSSGKDIMGACGQLRQNEV